MLKVRRARSGILLNLGRVKIGLDNGSAEINLISHAHTDHIVGRNESKLTIASEETVNLYSIRKSTKIKRYISLKPGKQLEVDGIYITAFDAGHVLGSLQFLIEYANYSILYTGDFNNEDSIIYKGAKPIEADVLIVDSTYGKPDYVFPPRKELYSRMITEALKALSSGKIPVFQGYSLGKAQEAVAIFQRLKIPVFIGDDSTEKINQVYGKFGVKLNAKNIRKANPNVLLSSDAVIVTSNVGALKRKLQAFFGHEGRQIINRLKVFPLTGWAVRMKFGIPLSGHADFPRLLTFIDETRAKKVYAFTSNGRYLARFLKNRGIDAEYI